MYSTLCVLALVALCAGLAHSFSWEIVTGVSNRLEFIDINGTLTHAENATKVILYLSYDPVHNRVLYADSSSIYSFDIGTKKTELLTNTTYKGFTGFTYDPATELLFWIERSEKIYSMSLKPELNNRKFNEKQFTLAEHVQTMAVDSCGGFIYGKGVFYVYKSRFNGSEGELIIDPTDYISSLTIDQQSQKMYYFGDKGIQSADLNGKNVMTIHRPTDVLKNSVYLAVSKDFIYTRSYNYMTKKFGIWQYPKSSPRGIDVEPKLFIERDDFIMDIVANYNIGDVIRENPNCATLKSLLPNITDVSLVCVHGTKVSGESRCECAQGYSGERCDGAVCHNYCLHGNCSVSAEGQPKCSCNAGYSGERCEVNDGGYSLSEENKPLLTKCIQAISLLKDLLNTDVTSDNMLQMISKDVKPLKSLVSDLPPPQRAAQ